MSNIDNEKDYSDLSSVLNFAFEQMLKGIYTTLPGIVVSYDEETKRGIVQPAIQLQKTDGTLVDRPPIANVPFAHPSGGGFVLHLPVKKGDAVLCMFSARGLSKFKLNYQISKPDEGFFDIKDAVAIPGFGSLAITPATSDGVSMQSEDGSNAVYVEDGHIRLKTPAKVQVDCTNAEVNCTDTVINGDVLIDGSLTWTGNATGAGGGPARFSSGIEATNGEITHNGKNIGDTHTHSGVQTGPSNTGTSE